jgi:hypothetical protein
MADLEHVHAVEAGVDAFIALIVGAAVQHTGADLEIIITVQHFSDQIKVLLQRIRETPQAADKIIVQAIGHIQAQAVNAEILDPISDSVKNMIDYRVIAQIQLDQIIVPFPAFIPEPVIIVGVALKADVEPVFIPGLFPVGQHIPELGKASAYVVKDTVQDDPDAIGVELITDLLKILIGSQPDIDLLIVSCIVTVIVRLKDRAEIDGVDAQLPHMRDPVDDFQDPVLQFPVIMEGSSAKSKRINLIKYTFFCPHKIRFLSF